MKSFSQAWAFFFVPLAMCLSFAFASSNSLAQEAQQKPAVSPVAKEAEKAGRSEKPAHPAQIDLLETKVRFESNGDSRKEVHALVKINSELGVRQFSQLNFDFNSSFESVEIPMVHITYANGGTSDILPGAITDRPNPAVVNAPAYQDVRVKSVRILGLQPGDTLEYRVIRTVSHHPLAPEFWLEHSFDRAGVVSEEDFQLDLPVSRHVEVRINPATPAKSQETTGEGASARTTYVWHHKLAGNSDGSGDANSQAPDVALSTMNEWSKLSARIAQLLYPVGRTSKQADAKAKELAASADRARGKLETIYDFVAQNISTVDVPLGSTGYQTRPPDEILASGYATQEDKAALLASFARALHFEPSVYLTFPNKNADLPSLPGQFDHVLLSVPLEGRHVWMDPAMQVAPLGMVSDKYRGKIVFCASAPRGDPTGHVVAYLPRVADDLPFAATQKVNVGATLAENGTLRAKVRYSMRGDNELVLRTAFHRTAKEKWKEVAQILSITDGFRGQVTSVNASDPYATKEPFTVEYELEQPKFVDWAKKPVRIPALLPELGLPDPPAKPASGSATAPVELGTPLEVDTRMTLHLPPGSTASAPVGTSVQRDYATYASQYSTNGSTITASRHIQFILRQVPADRAADYNAFLHVVQSDEAQDFTLERLERPETRPSKTNSAAPDTKAPPKATPAKP